MTLGGKKKQPSEVVPEQAGMGNLDILHDKDNGIT